jgi:hypothetical protein
MVSVKQDSTEKGSTAEQYRLYSANLAGQVEAMVKLPYV